MVDEGEEKGKEGRRFWEKGCERRGEHMNRWGGGDEDRPEERGGGMGWSGRDGEGEEKERGKIFFIYSNRSDSRAQQKERKKSPLAAAP